MYSEIKEEVYQGDIIQNYNFIVAPLGKPYAFIDKNTEPILVDEVTTPVTQIIANSFTSSAIVITQTCDVQRRKYIAVSPVFLVENISAELQSKGYEQGRINNFLRDLRAQKINYHFHLPEMTQLGLNFPESYVDLQVINSMPIENIPQYERLLTLSDLGRHRLTYQITNLFSRPI